MYIGIFTRASGIFGSVVGLLRDVYITDIHGLNCLLGPCSFSSRCRPRHVDESIRSILGRVGCQPHSVDSD